jgi:hypothetical protein
MNNRERSEKLFDAARRIYQQVEENLSANAWNLAVRRSQEVVELVLKGLLSEMGVEYPKVHDVAQVFIEEVERRGLKVERSTAEKILETSSELSRKRAPAFYFEADYTEFEARDAARAAKEILSLGEDLLKKLRGIDAHQ